MVPTNKLVNTLLPKSQMNEWAVKLFFSKYLLMGALNILIYLGWHILTDYRVY